MDRVLTLGHRPVVCGKRGADVRPDWRDVERSWRKEGPAICDGSQSLWRTSNLGQFVAARCAANHALREIHKQSTVACEFAARRPRPASTSAIPSADGGEVNAGRSAGAVSAVAVPPTRRKVGVLLCLMAITSLQRFRAADSTPLILNLIPAVAQFANLNERRREHGPPECQCSER
jgi:hypothetical protein